MQHFQLYSDGKKYEMTNYNSNPRKEDTLSSTGEKHSAEGIT